jgi:hypothetical protein
MPATDAARKVVLDAESDPAPEPEDVDVDEPHRPRECGDPIRNPVLHSLRSLLGLLYEHRIRLEREVRDALAIETGATHTRRAGSFPLRHGRRLLSRFSRRGSHASWCLATLAWTISAPTHIATSAVARAGLVVCISRSYL